MPRAVPPRIATGPRCGRDETTGYRVNQPAATATLELELTRSKPRALYYLALTKPRVLTMILVATLSGFYLGSAGHLQWIGEIRRHDCTVSPHHQDLDRARLRLVGRVR